MPIEPSSVSSSTIREVEKPSLAFGSWTSMQGSSTGGKDSPTNSIWEKAIAGAQKLFGLDSSESPNLDESKDSEDGSDQPGAQPFEQSFGAPSGFGSRSFGSFVGTTFGGDTFGSVVTSRVASDPRPVTKENGARFGVTPEEERAVPVTRDAADEATGWRSDVSSTKEKPVVEDALDDEETLEHRPQAGIVPRSATTNLASSPLQAVQEQAQALSEPTVLQQSVPQVSTASPRLVTQDASPSMSKVGSANSQEGVVSPPLQSTSKQISMTATQIVGNDPQSLISAQAGLTQQVSAEAVAKGAGQIEGLAAKNGQTLPVTPETVKSAQGLGQGPQVQTQDSTSGDLSKKAVVPPSAVQTSSQTNSQERSPAAASEGLGFDVSRAKEAVSEGIARAASGVSKPVAVQAQGASVQAVAQPAIPALSESGEAVVKPLTVDGLASRPALAGTVEGKEIPTAESTKRDVSVEARTAVAKHLSTENPVTARSSNGGSEGVVVDAKTIQSGASTSAGANQFARETATAAAARIQTPTTQGGPNNGQASNPQQGGLSGVGSTQGTSVPANGSQQGGSQNSAGGDPGAKKDFSEVLKQSGGVKGTEKLTSDSGQSFEAKVDEMTGRRSEAASKARQTSYVSKTAEEVKEVVATLTKSIDRLVTNKAGAMNLKINFEGGGSVNLRISMETGQVSTAMQTDVVGLEAAIKANWGELANDWNQKGVKLNTPQFQNSESGKQSTFDDLNEFASKQERQANGQSGEGRGRASGGQTSFNRGFGNTPTSDSPEQGLQNSEIKEKVVSSKELKTYA